MKLLLINPRFPESLWSFKWAVDTVLPGKRAINPPLGLATLAALCPADWDVSIVDENIASLPLAPEVLFTNDSFKPLLYHGVPPFQ